MAPDGTWVEFDTLVEPLPWGRTTYTILRLDETLVDAAAAVGTRRVEGDIEGVAVNVGVNRADVLPDAFMYAGRALQRRLGVTPGDVVRCRLRPADPAHVPLPDDVRAALETAGRLEAFEGRSPPARRRLLQPVEEAAQAATRARRVAALVRALDPG